MNIRKPDIINNYLHHKEINNYLDYLSRRYSHFVTVSTIGISFEERPLKIIKIHFNKCRTINKSTKDWIFIEAGTHAREWITISVALYCIYQLVEKNNFNRDVLERFNFVIMPVVNADGYEYSLEKNPFWRKNRRPIPNSKGYGIDCNRNYDFQWKQSPSKRKFSSAYQGEMPFSEPETCAVRNIMQNLNCNLKFFLSLHSYAQTIMYPWGYTKELPSTWKDLHDLAECGKNAIQQATGRKYRCGSIATIFRRTYTGSIVDYAYGAQKIPYVLVMELPSPKFGFHPPKDKIKLIAEETWTGIKAMCHKVGNELIVKTSHNSTIIQCKEQ